MSIEKTLEVFKKRTPQEKQQYIYKLVRENNDLRNQTNALGKRIERLKLEISEKETT